MMTKGWTWVGVPVDETNDLSSDDEDMRFQILWMKNT